MLGYPVIDRDRERLLSELDLLAQAGSPSPGGRHERRSPRLRIALIPQRNHSAVA